jgi:hypothetical protein
MKQMVPDLIQRLKLSIELEVPTNLGVDLLNISG